MANESDELRLKLEIENKQARQAIGQAKGDVAELAENLDLTKPLQSAAKLLTGPVGGGLAVAGSAAAALKKNLDLTIQAEGLIQITRSFDALAESANLAGNSLKAGLVDAAQGLAGDNDILQAANKAIVSMGENAKVIPETMELARKATALFGGDLVQNFETFNQALASGNVRALRQFGIIVDSKKAQEDYARSIGVTVDVLSEQGRRQAIVNAALDQARTKLRGVDESTLLATNSKKRLGVAYEDLGEAIAKAFKNSDFFARKMDEIRGILEKAATSVTANFGQGAEQAAAKTKALTIEVDELQKKLKLLQDQAMPTTVIDDTARLLKRKQAELDKIIEAEAEAGMKKRARDFASGRVQADPAAGSGPGKEDIDPLAAARKRMQAQNLLNQLDQSAAQAALQMRESEIQSITDHQMRLEAMDQLAADRRLMIEQDFEAKKKALRDQNAIDKQLSTDQLNRAIESLDQESAARRAAILDASEIELKEKQKQMAEGLKSILVRGISSGIQSMTQALVKGQNAFDAFGKALFNMLGDMAIFMGETFISASLGMLAMGGLNPAQGLVAGAALVAIGGVLKAFGGGGETPAGGGVAAAPTTFTEQPEVGESKKETSVQVIIQGNVLDRKETGFEIVDIINEHFAASDGRMVRAS